MSIDAPAQIAVVVNTFNDAQYLREALDSVYAQTHRPDEVFVVDDGSRESPVDIVAAYAGAVLIRQENGGLAAARNAGLDAARSEFITFLDAD